jgi:hypothetical protein
VKVLAVIGAVSMFSGIILGIPALSNIRDASEEETDAKREGKMFSDGDGIDPLSSPVARTMAFGKYEETHRDGPLIKRLRIAQAIFVAGVLISIIGIFV